MPSAIAVVVHVLIVFSLVAGILGRNHCYTQAARASDLERLRFFVEAGGQFERGMVRPGTFAVPIAGLIAAWARGWPILGFLQGATLNWVLAALVIYLTIIPVILLVIIPRGRVFRRAYEQALQADRITPELQTALNDPAVNAARAYELILIVVLTYLMVARPF